MLVDYHVHSEFSDDSVYPVNSVCEDAIRLNLDEICFTDHVDYGVKPDHDHPEDARLEDGQSVLNVDYDRYFPTVAAAPARRKTPHHVRLTRVRTRCIIDENTCSGWRRSNAAEKAVCGRHAQGEHRWQGDARCG